MVTLSVSCRAQVVDNRNMLKAARRDINTETFSLRKHWARHSES